MGPSVFMSRPRPYPLQLITRGENEREETLGHARPGSQKAQQGLTSTEPPKPTSWAGVSTTRIASGMFMEIVK